MLRLELSLPEDRARFFTDGEKWFARERGASLPDQTWSPQGGAVYTTAMALLALEQDRSR